MYLKKSLIISFLCLSFNFIISSTGFSEAVFVQGSTEDLPAVVHSRFLEDHPVILFSKDLVSNDVDLSGRDKFLSTQINTLILKGSSPRDIAVESAACQEIEITDFREKSELEISVPQTGLYEIYLATDKLHFSENESLSLSIGNIRPVDLSRGGILAASGFYFRVAEVHLLRNKHHKLKITFSGLEKSSESVRGLTLFLVNKQKRIGLEKIFLQKISDPATKLCYILTNKIGQIKIPSFWVGLNKNSTIDLNIKIRLSKNMTESEESKKMFGPDMMEKLAQAYLFQINAESFCIQDFDTSEHFPLLSSKKDILLEKTIRLSAFSAHHGYEMPQHPLYEVKWVLLEPKATGETKNNNSLPTPRIVFKRINPAKCLIQVKGAQAPFWLIFNEAFQEQWMLFLPSKKDADDFINFSAAPIAQYPHFGVTENAHDLRFIPNDVVYRFSSPLNVRHLTVNGFANGWYLDPKQLGLGTDFDLVLFFRPQAYAYLGWMVTTATLCLSAILLLWKLCRK